MEKSTIVIPMEKGRLVVTPIAEDKYELVEDFGDIPAGFVTDGASIPRFAWRIIDHPFRSDYIEVYVVHDYDYATGRVTRKEADERMLEGLKAAGMPWLKRYAVYWAVRWFGGNNYDGKN